MRAVAVAILVGSAFPAIALAQGTPAYPTIREIIFSGNDTTRSDVLLREMVVHVGDPADPDRIERSRQAIQDLRLFRSVDLREEMAGDGIRLLITLREKYYVLPLPRANVNSDGQYSYGIGMRWWNVWGLNHTLHAVVEQGNRQEAGRGDLLQYRASYDVPFVFDSPFGLGLSVAHSEEAVTEPLSYDEVSNSARWELSRALGDGPASQGWRVGSGLQWLTQERVGPGAPDSAGQATALVLFAKFNDMHSNIYSEQGSRFSFEVQSTAGSLASDYDYHELIAAYDRSWAVGGMPHRTLGVFAEGGVYDGGPEGAVPAFSLGGTDNLRGYPLRVERGNSYYYGGLEFLQPLSWNWLRGVAFVEAGNVIGEGSNGDPGAVYADVGIGLRLRLNWFVRTELNIGYAVPLVDGGDGRSGRIYASGHR